MKRTIVFDSGDAELGTLADVMLRGGALEVIEQEGFAVFEAPEASTLRDEIVLAQAAVNDTLNAQQNAAARLVRLGLRMVEEDEARVAPTTLEVLRPAVTTLAHVADALPPEGYALPAQLALNLATFVAYLENNGYDDERRPAPADPARGGRADEPSSGGDEPPYRGPGAGGSSPGGDPADGPGFLR